MKQRINFFAKGQNAMKAMFGLGAYLGKCTIEQELLHLIYFRVSQINGCAYCLDMHSKDLLATGENPQRLFLLDAWREAPLYSARERAALVWAEAVTKITNGDVPDEVYAIANQEFSEEELIDLTLAITTINAYNRFNISFRTEAGGYKVGQHKVQTA
ncbi:MULTISPECIES: carboxymuconolactone decarboxylase family protein [Sphingobacterium]|uniref:Carboxymuconolactone decarboxylase family protein n=1 Tax=Sphingobacterium athyrii TaxID=2152717 RepID=A0A363NK49_9SPHI|nr:MULTISPECIES: carboxymuconolactone decarboxylase family protein [Sphingobacterium]PUV21189.1 carboxymuconolactone decarboxylase family protein [Sphingobacterium athyrii]